VKREAYEEGRAFANLSLERQSPAVLLYDAMGNCQALSCPFADLFGRKERIKNLLPIFLGNPPPAIGD
jgi:hypothetical protein